MAGLFNEKKVLGFLTLEIAEEFNLIEHKGKKIVIYEDRKNYIGKHKDEYKTEDSFNKTINNLSSIITAPDFVYYHESINGLEYFKLIDEDVLVAVRVMKSKELKVRSVYQVSKTKIENRKNKINKRNS